MWIGTAIRFSLHNVRTGTGRCSQKWEPPSTGVELSPSLTVKWVWVRVYSNYFVRLCSPMCEYKCTSSHALLTISHNLFASRVRPSVHSSGIPLASVLVWVLVKRELFVDHGDDNFQGFHSCASSTSHGLHHASGGAGDWGGSWAWRRRWRCTSESWTRGICPHEGRAHRFPGSCLRAFALALCRPVF
jgi:hypothetical protein